MFRLRQRRLGKLTNITIKTKLIGAGIALSALLCAILLLTVYFFGNLEKGFQQIVDTSGAGVLKSQSADATITKVNQELAEMSRRMATISSAISKSNMGVQITARKIKKLSAELNDVTETIDEVYEELEDGETKDALDEATGDIGDIQEGMKREALIGLDMAVKELQQFTEEIKTTSSKTKELTRRLKISKTLSNEVMAINSGIQQESLGFNEIIAKNGNILAVIILCSAVIVLILGLIFARSITTPLSMAVNMLNEMAAGHLDHRLNLKRADELGEMARTMDSFANDLQQVLVTALEQLAAGDITFEVKPKNPQDVIGTSLKKTSDQLNRIISEIMIATEQIAVGSKHISGSSQVLSEGATESAAALEQITASMAEMGAQTKTNASQANETSQLAGQAKQAAEVGNQQMSLMVEAMTEINNASQSISKIIKVIDEIAFQTNLLALNAAVEAARAGRHGKGFTVVAGEVRNLAARSAKAAQETTDLIEGSILKTKNGSQIANQTAKSLETIVEAIAKVTDLAKEIATSSNEQAEGIYQVNSGLSQIDQVTQQNTASAEEGAAAAEELSSQAELLKNLTATFTVKKT